MLIDSLLLRLNATPGKESAVLAIPENFADRIITLYHSRILTGHQGVIKVYLTINEKFFIQDLIHYLRAYIKGFPICQLHRNEKPQPILLQDGINHNYKAITRLHMDLKVMPRSYKGHIFILVVIDEVTNFMVTIPIHQSTSEEIGDALTEHVFGKYSIPECMIMDENSAFMSILIMYLFKKLGIEILTIAP